MIRSVRAPGRRSSPELQIAPMIDLMFTLLIFFIVTANFVRETGLEVERPSASTASSFTGQQILVGIGAGGEVFCEGRRVELLALRLLFEQRLARTPDAPVIVVADRRTQAAAITRVMDAARAAGARRVGLATQRDGGDGAG